jgi:hypothetical protein
MIGLVDRVNQAGDYYALYCSLQTLSGITETEKAMEVFVAIMYRSLIGSKIEALNSDAGDSFWSRLNARPDFKVASVNVILSALSAWRDKDLASFFDEADCLVERPLLSFLAQLRDGS